MEKKVIAERSGVIAAQSIGGWLAAAILVTAAVAMPLISRQFS